MVTVPSLLKASYDPLTLSSQRKFSLDNEGLLAPSFYTLITLR